MHKSFLKKENLKRIFRKIISHISTDEWVIFAISACVGFIFEILYGVFLTILFLWLKLKWYEKKILDTYEEIREKEQEISLEGGVSQPIREKRLYYVTKPYYFDIEKFEINRRFLIDKLSIITFIGLLLLGKN